VIDEATVTDCKHREREEKNQNGNVRKYSYKLCKQQIKTGKLFSLHRFIVKLFSISGS